MKKLILFLLCAHAMAQNIRVDGTALGPKGSIPFASIAACTQPANSSTQPCSPLATLCSSLTDGVCTSPNPVSSDFLGNFHFYIKSVQTPFTLQIYGQQVASPIVLVDQGSATSSGGVAAAAPPNAAIQFNVGGVGGLLGGSANLTWNNGLNLFALTTPGIFTNTQMNEYLTSVINTCSSSTESQRYAGGFGGGLSTNGISSCVAGSVTTTSPSLNGIASYVQGNTAGNGTVPTAVVGQCVDLANDASCVGGAFVVGDAVNGNTQTELFGIFSHVITKDPASAYQLMRGIDSIGDFQGAGQIQFPAFLAESLTAIPWLTSYSSPDGAALNGLDLGAVGKTGTHGSQGINLHGIVGGVDSGIASLGADSTSDLFAFTPNGATFMVGAPGGGRLFSTYPACSSAVEGGLAIVSDSTTNAGGATITGGGAIHVEGYCNGTNWIVATGIGGGLTASGPPTANQWSYFTSGTNLAAQTVGVGYTVAGNNNAAAPTINKNPLISCAFDLGNSDRGLAIHDAVVALTNGVSGDTVDSRCELSTGTSWLTNPFPTLLDGLAGATIWLGSGLSNANIPGGVIMNVNQVEIHGTTVGNHGGTGGTTIRDSRANVGSGATFNPAAFAWGSPAYRLMGTGAGNAGFPGPYSSSMDSIDYDCNLQDGGVGLTAFSGQDNTIIEKFAVTNCRAASVIISGKATSNGELLRGFYITHSSATAAMGNTVGAGGLPWTSNAYYVTNIGNNRAVVVMTAPTGGTAGNAASVALVPGIGTIVGTYGANGTAVPLGTVHSTNLNGDYEIAAKSDVFSVTAVSGTGGAANTSLITLSITAADFPADSQITGSTCTAAFANCNGDAVIYLSGFGGGATSLNGATMTIASVTGTTVVGWVTTSTGGITTGTGTAAYSNTINGYEQSNKYTFLGVGSLAHATPFTAANQIAWTIYNPSNFANTSTCNSLANSCMDSHDNTSPGTITAFTRDVDINAPNNNRGMSAGTIVCATCTNFAGATSLNGAERPLHGVDLSGIGLSMDTIHIEDVYHCGICIGFLDITGNVTIKDALPVTNVGYIGSVQPNPPTGQSDKSCAVEISNQFGAPYSINIFNLRSGAGLGFNQALNSVCDDTNSNTLTSANNGNLTAYQIDSSGTGVFMIGNPVIAGTSCTELQNGTALYNGSIYVCSGGLLISQLSTAGFTLNKSGTNAGMESFAGGSTTPTCPANQFCIVGPNAATFTQYGLQFPTTGPVSGQVATFGTPDGTTKQAQVTFTASPTFTAPNIGAATATSINKVAITAPATSATLTVADGKTLTATNTMDVAKTAGTAGGLWWADTTTSQSSTGAGTAKQVVLSGGAGTPTFITFPSTKYSPAADCVNTVAGSAWSTGATPAALCRAGTNNKSALLSPWGASDVGYVQYHIDADADLTTTLPTLMLELTSTDATNGHTVIMQESVACAKEDGTTTDDVAFNAARSLATITLNGNANRVWDTTITLNSTDLTGCAAPGIMWVKISRTTDTATNVGVYGLNLTESRLLVSQAN